MTRYVRHHGLALQADKNFLHLIPDLAKRQLESFRANGGFIAGGYARAVYLSAVKHMTKEQLSDQFSDIDVYFDRDVNKSVLSDADCWSDCSQAYNNAMMNAPPESGAYIRYFGAAPKQKIPERVELTSSSVKGVTVNAIMFKSGQIEDVLDSFDLVCCKVAIDGDDIITHSDFSSLERDAILSLDQKRIEERLSKQVSTLKKQTERIAKYYDRMKKLYSITPKLSEKDLEFMKEILFRSKNVYLSPSFAKLVQDQYVFSDALLIAMSLWPTSFMNSGLVRNLMGVPYGNY
ncbi:MAG: hypothetical protein E6Q36_07460 [Chryseobacterium sp.]|nr:MAG: hypothetical protein E6Q36_07460 [Chryseobacterium sp.]